MSKQADLIHIAGVSEREGGPALTGIYIEPAALLGYAANMIHNEFGNRELADAVRALADRKGRRPRQRAAK